MAEVELAERTKAEHRFTPTLPPRPIKFHNALPDERFKFLDAHVAEFIYLCALDLLHVEPHELAAFHFRGDSCAQLTCRP